MHAASYKCPPDIRSRLLEVQGKNLSLLSLFSSFLLLFFSPPSCFKLIYHLTSYHRISHRIVPIVVLLLLSYSRITLSISSSPLLFIFYLLSIISYTAPLVIIDQQSKSTFNVYHSNFFRLSYLMYGMRTCAAV